MRWEDIIKWCSALIGGIAGAIDVLQSELDKLRLLIGGV